MEEHFFEVFSKYFTFSEYKLYHNYSYITKDDLRDILDPGRYDIKKIWLIK